MAKKARKTKFRILLLVLLVFVSIGYWLYQHPVVHAYLVGISDLDQLAPKLYVDPEMPEGNREFLLDAVAKAETRITNLFGDYQAKPTIIAGHTMIVMSEYGGNTYNRVGRTYLTALGQYIVLGPDGSRDIDVIAHEIAHAELAERIGHQKANALPDWFEEGLALQVDERFTEDDWLEQTAEGKNAPSLDEIGTIQHDDWLAYATAKHEVSRWLALVGQEGLLDFLEMLRQGEDFQAAYETFEAQYASAQLSLITIENAAEVELLQTYEIPGFQFSRETCGVAFSPDSKYLAAACMSKTILIVDTATQEIANQLTGDQIWTGVAFSPDSQTLAATGQSTTIVLWDIVSGEMAGELSRAPGSMNVPIFSPDGSKLLAGSYTGQALVWDIETDRILVQFTNHNSRVNSVAVSPDRSLGASGGGDNRARVWDIDTGEEIFSLFGARYFVEDVKFSPDGQYLLGAADDSVIRIWNMSDGKIKLTMAGHDGPVNGIAYHPDGTLFASCGNDQSLRIWNAETGKLLATLVKHTDYAIRPAFNPEGTLIATIGWDGNLLLWGIPQ